MSRVRDGSSYESILCSGTICSINGGSLDPWQGTVNTTVWKRLTPIQWASHHKDQSPILVLSYCSIDRREWPFMHWSNNWKYDVIPKGVTQISSSSYMLEIWVTIWKSYILKVMWRLALSFHTYKLKDGSSSSPVDLINPDKKVLKTKANSLLLCS